jgi:hypothetical protein
VTAKSYDPTLKVLVEAGPESWPTLFDRPTAPTTVIDADIATVSGAADKVLRVAADPPYLLHLEFVSGHDTATLPRKLHMRNGVLEDRHDLPVLSGAILLRPEADSPQLTGWYERGFPDEEPYLRFGYRVVRVWRLPPERLLTGGLPLLALAPISAVTEAELPGIIEQMKRRLGGRRARHQADVVWEAAFILLGLRYSADLAEQLFRGIVSMEESATYQAILARGREQGLQQGREQGRREGRTEGAVAEARKALRIVGDAAFGEPDARTATAIEQLDDLGRLEDLLKRVPTAGSWQELLGQPGPGRRGRRGRRAP